MIEGKLTRTERAEITSDCVMLLHLAEQLMKDNDTRSDLFHIGAELNGRMKSILRIVNPTYLKPN